MEPTATDYQVWYELENERIREQDMKDGYKKLEEMAEDGWFSDN